MSNRTARVYCRNSRCRTKLPVPTDNEHKAFCSPYCYNQFFHWKCAVCEDPIPRGRHSKPRKCCRKPKCRHAYKRFHAVYSAPDWGASKLSSWGSSQSIEPDSKNPCGTGAFFGDRSVQGWRWETSGAGHRLFFHDRHLATIEGVEGDWSITWPATIPVQGAATLEAARKKAIEVALWTLPIDPATAQRLARTNRRYRGNASVIKSGAAPINLIGGHRVVGDDRLDPALRGEIIATEATIS
jgi:hypothetical protein